jgi:hypothetical protein
VPVGPTKPNALVFKVKELRGSQTFRVVPQKVSPHTISTNLTDLNEY